LAKRVVEALEMMALASFVAHGLRLGSGHHVYIHHVRVRIKRDVSTVGLWEVGPHCPGALATAVTEVKTHHLASFRAHGQPYPVAVVTVTPFLRCGRLTRWADITDGHGFLLTSAGLGCVFESTIARHGWTSMIWISLPLAFLPGIKQQSR
jgi:hypothetical protein